jgi:hypothetical protein
VNAFGDVRDAAGRVLAGARGPGGRFAGETGTDAAPGAPPHVTPASPFANTTLAVVAASRPLDRVALAQLARAAAAALYRRITPCGTTFDGDVIFALCPDDPPPPADAPADRLRLEVLAVRALEEAVERAVRFAVGRTACPASPTRPHPHEPPRAVLPRRPRRRPGRGLRARARARRAAPRRAARVERADLAGPVRPPRRARRALGRLVARAHGARRLRGVDARRLPHGARRPGGGRRGRRRAARGRAGAPAAGSDLRVALGCTARVGGRTLRLPLGAWVAPAGALLAGEAVPLAELPERFPADGEAVVRTARRYFESTSYQWGGLTPWGADCSGMVQAVYALHGAALPRDAWQQAGAGRDAGGDLAAHAPGDLLFFSDRDDGRVTHVGLAGRRGRDVPRRPRPRRLGGGRPRDDTDDAYARRLRAQFVGARRVLG